MRQAEFDHPSLVMVYDAAFGWSRDDDFFLSVVDATPGARVLDLGCGTGAARARDGGGGACGHRRGPGRRIAGRGRAKPGADRVRWIEGTSAAAPDAAFDVAVMTSHVAQFLVSDEEWGLVLADLRRALVPGGLLTFDTRDPSARGWEHWNPAESRREVALPDGRTVIATTDVELGHRQRRQLQHQVRVHRWRESAEHGRLAFRTEDELRSSLAAAGFAIEHIYGGWNREPVGAPATASSWSSRGGSRLTSGRGTGKQAG